MQKKHIKITYKKKDHIYQNTQVLIKLCKNMQNTHSLWLSLTLHSPDNLGLPSRPNHPVTKLGECIHNFQRRRLQQTAVYDIFSVPVESLNQSTQFFVIQTEHGTVRSMKRSLNCHIHICAYRKWCFCFLIVCDLKQINVCL